MPEIKHCACRLWLVMLLLSLAVSAVAASPTEPLPARVPGPARLDFDVALQRALISSVRVRKAAIEVDLSELARVRANSAFYPQLDLNSSTQRIEAHGTTPGLETLLLSGRSSVYSASTSLRLGVNLYSGGANAAAVRLAEERMREANLQLKLQRIALARALLERFHAARLAEIDLRSANLQREGSAAKLTRARAEFDSGRLAQIFRDDAQFELQQRELERATEERGLAQALGELQSMLGDLDPVQRTTEDNDYTESLAQRGLTGAGAVTEVDVNESRIKQAAIEVDRSRSRFLPKVDLFTQVSYSGLNESGASAAFRDQRKDKTFIGLNISWNLFDGFDSTAELRSNKLRVEAARTDVELSLEENRRQQEELKRPLADSQGELQLQGQRLALAKARLDISRVQLETGRTDGTGHYLAEIDLTLQSLEVERIAELLAYRKARLELLPREP